MVSLKDLLNPEDAERLFGKNNLEKSEDDESSKSSFEELFPKIYLKEILDKFDLDLNLSEGLLNLKLAYDDFEVYEYDNDENNPCHTFYAKDKKVKDMLIEIRLYPKSEDCTLVYKAYHPGEMGCIYYEYDKDGNLRLMS